MLLLIYLLAIASESMGQVVRMGKCPRPDPVEDFDEEYLIGDWQEGWRIPNDYQPDFKCAKTKHYRDENCTLVERVDSVLASDGALVRWEAGLIPKDNCRPGEYFLTFAEYATEAGVDVTFTEADWDSWVIMFGCAEHFSLNRQFVWIWVKDVNNCDEKAIVRAVERLGICFKDLIKINHDNCPVQN